MQTLRTASKPEERIPPEEILETLLVEAGTAGELPTNEKKLLRYLGLEQMSFDFMNELSFLDTEQKPPGFAEKHVLPCALIVYEKTVGNEESFVEDDDYRIQYTITSPSFRRLYFSAVQISGDTSKAAELFGPNEFWRVGNIVEKELAVENRGKEAWRFETEVFSNGYKIFQFLKRPVSKNRSNSR